MATYLIPEYKFDDLQKKAKQVQKKCQKFGGEFKFEVIGESYKEIKDKKSKYTIKYIEVDCRGVAKFGNWQCVGLIDFDYVGNIITPFIDIKFPDKYWNTPCTCDHCHTNRKRTQGYLIQNLETGEFAQVGKSCLKDYTGIDISVAAAIAELNEEAEEVSRETSAIPASKKYFAIDDILAYAYNVVKHLGYCSSTSVYQGNSGNEEDTTKFKVHTILKYFQGRADYMETEWVENFIAKYNVDFYSEEIVETVKAIRDLCKGLTDTDSYSQRLKGIALRDYIKLSYLGLCVSMVPYYTKYLKSKSTADDSLKTSAHQGKVGDKIEITNPAISIVSSWTNGYGDIVHRYQIVSNDGDVYIWDTAVNISETKSVQKIVGKIKYHSVYHEVAQTWITYGKVHYA